ncbi:MAG: hypothetical protein ACRD4E_11070, partial [Bryobacteraceae bacterium]
VDQSANVSSSYAKDRRDYFLFLPLRILPRTKNSGLRQLGYEFCSPRGTFQKIAAANEINER